MSLPKPYYEEEGITIYHGDCLEILPGLNGIEAVVTDPPYGTRTDQREEWMVGEFGNVMPLALPLIRRALVSNGAFYCFTSWSQMGDWLVHYQQYFKLQNLLIWDKGRHSGCWSSNSWQFTWEGIYFGLKGPRETRKYLPDVLRSSETGKREPMQKPIDICRLCIEVSTDVGQTVLDPFCGTGSALIAAKVSDRKAIGIEIEERYCEIAAKRLQNTTPSLFSKEAV